MANDNGPVALPAQFSSDQSRDGTFAASGSHSANGNNGHGRIELSVFGSQEPEISIGSHRARAEMHEVLVRNVTVGKHYCVDLVFRDQVLQIFFFEDRYALRIQASGKLRRVTAAGYVGNLSGCECYDVIIGIIAKQNVEIMEIPTCRAKNQNSLHRVASIEDCLLCIFSLRCCGCSTVCHT